MELRLFSYPTAKKALTFRHICHTQYFRLALRAEKGVWF